LPAIELIFRREGAKARRREGAKVYETIDRHLLDDLIFPLVRAQVPGFLRVFASSRLRVEKSPFHRRI
jgi:hypothetical protein